MRWKLARYGIFAIVAACIAMGIGFFVWAKSRYEQPEAVSTAQEFLLQLKSRNFAGAHELTTKSGHVGQSLDGFRKLVESESDACWDGRFVSTHPPQTNGNRLRRWLRGEPMDMDQVNLEFVRDTCLLSVRLRRASDSGWKVYYFASHAG